MARIIGFWLLIGIVGGFIMYAIARARGAKQPGAWALLGTLLGPLVLFLIFWAQKKQTYKREDDRG